MLSVDDYTTFYTPGFQKLVDKERSLEYIQQVVEMLITAADNANERIALRSMSDLIHDRYYRITMIANIMDRLDV